MTLINEFKDAYDKVSIIDQCKDNERYKLLLNMVKKYNPEKTLDLGCAEGVYSVLLSLEGYNVTASDISEMFLNRARKLAEKSSTSINIVECDIEKDIKPFNGEVFDFIFLGETIEHFRNTSKALSNIRELITEEGVLFITTPNNMSFLRLIKVFLRRNKIENYFLPQNLGDLHLSYFDLDSLNKVLAFSGFKIIETLPMTTPMRFIQNTSLRIFEPIRIIFEKNFIYFARYIYILCKKTKPIDIDSQIEYWKKTLG